MTSQQLVNPGRHASASSLTKASGRDDNFESKAHQDYTWIIRPNGWKINFSDGTYFHDLELENTKQEVYHNCGNDIYRGRFKLNIPKEYEVIWNVSGPHKNYISHTCYNREIRI